MRGRRLRRRMSGTRRMGRGPGPGAAQLGGADEGLVGRRLMIPAFCYGSCLLVVLCKYWQKRASIVLAVRAEEHISAME